MCGRRQERRDERRTFGPGGDAVGYRMRAKLLSIGGAVDAMAVGVGS